VGCNHRYCGYRQIGQKQHAKKQPNRQPCPSSLAYLGNIFLLGLATLTTELIDLQAASALETLLQPFKSEQGENLAQDILAADIGENALDVDTMDVLGTQDLL